MSLSTQGIKVLVAEDSKTQALLLKESLEKHQIDVTLAKNGIEALEKMKVSLPHIIISDIEMPGMNGYELCKAVKSQSHSKDIPIILLTGLTDSMDVVRGISCGANNFLTKPCQTEFLISTIHDALKNRELKKSVEKKVLEFFFNGIKHSIEVEHDKILTLLLSTYTNAIQKNLELEKSYQKLNHLYGELEKTNKDLEETNQQKNQLLGMAAHDLRNPLGVITGYSDMVIRKNQDVLNEESVKMLEKIKTTSSFMLSIINDMLDYSVIESGTVSLRLSSVDLKELFEENLVFLRDLAEKKNIRIHFKAEDNIPKVVCDQNKISQVLVNLVTNAIKFSNSNQTIEIELYKDSDHVTFFVQDHGNGIPKDLIDQLFKPFSKASRLGTQGEKGTGLGLTIVQKIVESHNGKIWIRNEEGKGATFFVTLPFVMKSI